MKNKHKPLLKFMGYVGLGGIVGALAGGIMVLNGDTIATMQTTISDFFSQNAFNFLLGATILLTAISFGFYFNAKSLYQRDGIDNDTSFDRIDNRLSYGLIATTVSTICVFTFFGATVAYQQHLLASALVFIIGAFSAVFCQVKLINLTKLLYPSKKGHPLEVNFSKEWFASCDEAEKYIIYNAAYRTYSLMNMVYIFVWLLLLFSALASITGIFPIFLLAILWGIHALSYMVFSQKSAKGTIIQ